MTTSVLDTLLAVDISDPTDFPDSSTTQGLRQLDEALRCNICRDFYDAPVTLTCGHCFCSACIRSALPAQSLCPSCRKPTTEVHIRKDVAMEAAVQAWKIARAHILRISREEEERKMQPARPTVHKRSGQSDHVGRKRRRRGSSASLSEEEVVFVPSSPVPSRSSTPKDLPESVACPVCAHQVPSQTINMHLDSNCKRYLSEPIVSSTAVGSKNRQKAQWSQLLSKGGNSSSVVPAKRKDKDRGPGKSRATPEDGDLDYLPKVAYDIHPQKRIAAMLAEWNLPTQGDKATLVRRYDRWLVLYNANVDRAPEHRQSVDQLRKELQREEAEGKMRKETVDDPLAYQKANKAVFARLTDAARLKQAKAGSRSVEGVGLECSDDAGVISVEDA